MSGVFEIVSECVGSCVGVCVCQVCVCIVDFLRVCSCVLLVVSVCQVHVCACQRGCAFVSGGCRGVFGWLGGIARGFVNVCVRKIDSLCVSV